MVYKLYYLQQIALFVSEILDDNFNQGFETDENKAICYPY